MAGGPHSWPLGVDSGPGEGGARRGPGGPRNPMKHCFDILPNVSRGHRAVVVCTQLYFKYIFCFFPGPLPRGVPGKGPDFHFP